MRRLISAFVVCIWHKTHFRMTWPNDGKELSSNLGQGYVRAIFWKYEVVYFLWFVFTLKHYILAITNVPRLHNPKFEDSSQLLKLSRSVWVLPGCKPQRHVFSWHGSFYYVFFFSLQSVKEHEDHFHKRCNRLEDEFRDLLTLDIRGTAQHSNGTETHFKTQL